MEGWVKQEIWSFFIHFTFNFYLCEMEWRDQIYWMDEKKKCWIADGNESYVILTFWSTNRNFSCQKIFRDEWKCEVLCLFAMLISSALKSSWLLPDVLSCTLISRNDSHENELIILSLLFPKNSSSKLIKTYFPCLYLVIDNIPLS